MTEESVWIAAEFKRKHQAYNHGNERDHAKPVDFLLIVFFFLSRSLFRLGENWCDIQQDQCCSLGQ
jgi:hypothetical protein